MTINVNKSKMLRIIRERKYCQNEIFSINNETIDNVSNFHYLGIIIANDGSWKPHQQAMVTCKSLRFKSFHIILTLTIS